MRSNPLWAHFHLLKWEKLCDSQTKASLSTANSSASSTPTWISPTNRPVFEIMSQFNDSKSKRFCRKLAALPYKSEQALARAPKINANCILLIKRCCLWIRLCTSFAFKLGQNKSEWISLLLKQLALYALMNLLFS